MRKKKKKHKEVDYKAETSPHWTVSHPCNSGVLTSMWSGSCNLEQQAHFITV